MIGHHAKIAAAAGVIAGRTARNLECEALASPVINSLTSSPEQNADRRCKNDASNILIVLQCNESLFELGISESIQCISRLRTVDCKRCDVVFNGQV